MYRKDSEGWLKHFDFLVLDLLCLQVAFVLAYGISGYGFYPYNLLIYRNMAIFIEFADIVVLFACGTLKNVLKRGHYREFLAAFQNTIMLGAVAILYLFLLRQGQKYSRLALILNMILYFFLTYIVREIRKYALYKKMKDSDNRSLLIITTKEAAEKVVSNMEKHNYARFHIAGLAIIDENMVGSSFGGVTVVANRNTAPEYVCKEWIDEVFVVLSPNYGYPKELMEELGETGVTIHLNLAKITNEPGKRQFIEKIGDYTVLTTSLNYSSAKQLCAKRCMDIAGGLAGCILTGVIFLFVAPIIYMQLPVVGVEAQFSGLSCIFSDQVPEEVNFTNKSMFISLNEKKDIWADKVIAAAVDKTNRERPELKNSIFNIKQSTALLTDYYKKLINNTV